MTIMKKFMKKFFLMTIFYEIWLNYFLNFRIIKKMSSKEPYDFIFKVIIIGDTGVGKTNMILRFSENNFKENYVATIGVDFKIKTISLGDKRIRLQLWDTAGQ